MNKPYQLLGAVVLTAVAIAAGVVKFGGVQPPPFPMLNIEQYYNADCTNVVRPVGFYGTNYFNTNRVLMPPSTSPGSFTIRIYAYSNSFVRVWWTNDERDAVIQCSTNLFNWDDFEWIWKGSTNPVVYMWFDGETNNWLYFRLRGT